MVGLEGFVMVNFAMDLLLLLVAMRAQRRVRIRRAAVGAGIMTLAALLKALFRGQSALASLASGGMALAGCLCAFTAGGADISGALPCLAALLVSTVAMGGALTALKVPFPDMPASVYALGVGVSGAGLCWLYRQRRNAIDRIDVPLMLADGTASARINALLDTGNRLSEPISALPVLIVSSQALPERFGQSAPKRRVRYGALGAVGEMECFFPSEIRIHRGGRWIKGPDVWVAVYPGKMPGRVQALAPACFGLVNHRESKKEKEES